MGINQFRKPHFRDLFMLKLFAEGLSTKQLAELKFSDFLIEGFLIINHRGRNYYFKISNTAHELLKQYIRVHRTAYIICEDTNTPFLFCNRRGSRANRVDVLKTLKKVVKRVEADPLLMDGILNWEDLNTVKQRKLSYQRKFALPDLKMAYLSHPKAG